MHKTISLLIFLMTYAICNASVSNADIIDLGNPSIASHFSTYIVNPHITPNGDRNVVFDVVSTFTINSAGIVFDPLNGGAQSIEVQIFDMALTGGIGARHSLLSSNSTSISDIGVAFYEVPISFKFVAGTRYNVAFKCLAPDSWGFEINNMEFYGFFNYPDTPYTVDGLITVLDGGNGSGMDGGFDNTSMPHVRFNSVSAVPEPASSILFLLGGILFATRKYIKRSKI